VTDIYPRVQHPSFQENKKEIIAAAKCTAFVIIEEPKTDGSNGVHRYTGTAFFVSPTRLLTAGHNIVGVHGPASKICIAYPGLPKVTAWQVAKLKVPAITCKVVGTMYRRGGPYVRDIAILDSGSYSYPHHLSLSLFNPPEDAKPTVDVIGYPGDIKLEWITEHEGLLDYDKGQTDAVQLLPRGQLTVTRGEIENDGETIPYHISTCTGMSGSPVLYKGKVIGMFVPKRFLIG
jgi:V8-like Glu-specific endopeptidase